MIESLKRLVMALLFVYLGGVVAHTATAVAFGATGIAALQVGASWPSLVLLVLQAQMGLTV